MKNKIIAVDFDGTLCENKWPEIGEANEELITYLKERQASGDKTILWTCRTGEELHYALSMCYKRGLRFDATNKNLPEVVEKMGGDTRKIFADVYIDDKSSTMFKLPFVAEEKRENDGCADCNCDSCYDCGSLSF